MRSCILCLSYQALIPVGPQWAKQQNAQKNGDTQREGLGCRARSAKAAKVCRRCTCWKPAALARRYRHAHRAGWDVVFNQGNPLGGAALVAAVFHNSAVAIGDD